MPFSGLESIPTAREIADLLHIDEALIKANLTTKGGIQGLPSEFLVAQATIYGKAMSEDAFEAIFVLLIYGFKTLNEMSSIKKWFTMALSIIYESPLSSHVDFD